MIFDGFSTEDLRRELHRREEAEKKQRDAAWQRDITARYGVCEHVAGVSADVIFSKDGRCDLAVGERCGDQFGSWGVHQQEEILQAPDSWPPDIPCPPERCDVIGAHYKITLICRRGHETYRQQTRMFEKPMKALL